MTDEKKLTDEETVENEKNVLKLDTPIEVGNETVAELRFKEPTVLQIEKCGMPFRFSDGELTVDTAVCSKYISVLAEIPPSTVRNMSPKDFMRASLIVTRFFVD